ncbi:hypothetical protein D1K53_09820 [Salmonella enterica]|nr:hypothetical protein [Salmonella enterica]EAC0102549.1 hypothetical protein [Salmonella enterica subsp. arizonae]EAW2114699.1 hypothetical protein [Salmonella enterica subsp. enterica]ECU5740633.1 hypothetical protein [Salmonella enterica subsp. arizonae serovar 40:z4,z23:-]PVL53885.1 hypothetical protein C4803_15300 [Salmonella enterica subsp. arizonae serovar 51:g,z51:-]
MDFILVINVMKLTSIKVCYFSYLIYEPGQRNKKNSKALNELLRSNMISYFLLLIICLLH